MRILINMKEIGGKIGIEAKLDTGCRDTARERAAGEALFRHLGDHFATMEQTAEKPAADCPDGPRYKGIGNGQTVNVMRWLANRIKNGMET